MESEQDWRDVADSIEEDLDTFSREAGDAAAGLRKALRRLNREKRDYAAFLKKFAVRGEVMALDPAEFDYIYYTYGLRLYGNLPLIEPLEYREDLRIRSFVIAVDTSGSVSEELVHAFLQKTFNILKSTESFFTKVKIYVIQCDSSVKDVQVITSLDEVDDMVANLKLHGFGGTDFRPVFEYVDDLIDRHELIDLKGLIYFTDGYGEFPTRMPSYKSAFVFVDDGQINPDVPPWAIKLILDESEL
jgi:predicted metal-dependent peptidase